MQEESNKENQKKYDKVLDLVAKALEIYNAKSCQCAFPRYLQLSGIDCTNNGNSFRCYETEILISKSRQFYHIEKSENVDEITNEKWVCKKCNSVFEYGWSDFSIYVERQKLKLVELKTTSIGKSTKKPIPLYLGLIGHSYPSKIEMTPVDYLEFEKYILEY